MALPGLTQTVQDGNLGLLQGNNSQACLWLGCSLNGVANQLYSYGDQTTMSSALVGGELLEAATYALKTSGGPVYVMPMTPTTRGGVGSVTKVGTGAGTAAITIAPHAAITITCTTAGALGTSYFTFQVGSVISAPIASAAGWSSTGYLVPGTYVTVVFTAGSYIAGGTPDIYTISTLGVIAHPQGAGPAVPTFTASPVDAYSPLITITTAGALGTMQFTYSLDGTAPNASAAIVSPGGGAYALTVPASGIGTGLVVTFASTFVAGDTYSFKSTGPTFAAADLTAAMTALQTTYLAQAQYAMIAVTGTLASAAAWTTQVAALESAALTFFNNGVFLRAFSGCPTLGTVLPNAGSITVDVAETDSVVITQRQGMSAPHVVPCAGDFAMTSPLTGLTFRRNASWAAAARASKVEASKNIGAVADGGIANCTGLYRDENATPAFDAAGITSLRTFPNYSGYYITDAHTGTVSTSDYYPLANARVVDRACGIARLKGLPYINAKLPTTTKGANVGVITEKKAQQIERDVNGGLQAQLVNNVPQDAVGSSVVVNRTNNLLATGNLIMSVNVQPFAYARTITQVIGLQITAGT